MSSRTTIEDESASYFDSKYAELYQLLRGQTGDLTIKLMDISGEWLFKTDVPISTFGHVKSKLQYNNKTLICFAKAQEACTIIAIGLFHQGCLMSFIPTNEVDIQASHNVAIQPLDLKI